MVGGKYKEKLNEKINCVAKIFLGIGFVKAENSYEYIETTGKDY